MANRRLRKMKDLRGVCCRARFAQHDKQADQTNTEVMIYIYRKRQSMSFPSYPNALLA